MITLETIIELEEDDKIANKTLTNFNISKELIHHLNKEGGKTWQDCMTFVEAAMVHVEECVRIAWTAQIPSETDPNKTRVANHTGATEPAQEAGTASRSSTEAQEGSERSGHGEG